MVGYELPEGILIKILYLSSISTNSYTVFRYLYRL